MYQNIFNEQHIVCNIVCISRALYACERNIKILEELRKKTANNFNISFNIFLFSKEFTQIK